MRVNFPDDPAEPISEADALALMNEVNQFFTENSYGAISLSTTVTGLLTLPQPKGWYELRARPGLVLEHARIAAAAAGYRVENYDLDCVEFVRLFPVRNSWGYIASKGTMLQVNHIGLACHEFGHNLGLWHANAWQTTDRSAIGPGANFEYGNCFDTMGRGEGERWHFNTCFKNLLGWLPASAIQTVTTNGLYRIYPSDVPELVGGRAYALRLKKDFAREYWIETRQQLNAQPRWQQSLLLNWAPWGGSANGTQILAADPTSPDLLDAPLPQGQSFLDPELGVKITPWPTVDSETGAVDVLVQKIHQVVIEAEAGHLSAAAMVGADSQASHGQYLTATAGLGDADFTVELPTAGHYALWGRVLGPVADRSTLLVSVDGRWEGSLSTLPPARLPAWRWVRILGPTDTPAALLTAVPVFLDAGVHTLRVRLADPAIKLDCLLLTTDPMRNLLPTISPIAPQASLVDETLGPIPFMVLDVETRSSSLTVEAVSSNPKLFPAANLVLAGDASDRTLTLTPAPAQVGTATVTVTVTDADRNRSMAGFQVTVLGLVQALVEATAPGEIVTIPAGTYFDNLTVTKDLSIEGDGPVVIDGNGLGFPVTVSSNATVTLRGLTLRNGRGGGVKNLGALTLVECSVIGNQPKSLSESSGVLNRGALRMERCTVSRNVAAVGAGIHNYGTLHVSQCVISENAASLRGGGVLNENHARLLIEGSTLTANRVSSGHGGALYNAGQLTAWNTTISGNVAHRKDEEDDGGFGGGLCNLGTAILESSTVADNQAAVAAGGIDNRRTLVLRNTILGGNSLAGGASSEGRGPLTSHGHNLIQNPAGFTLAGVMTGNLLGVDPLLAPLADNGGPTPTHALQAGSPAIDRGSSQGLRLDQRGSVRPLDEDAMANADDACDIGAFEFVPEASTSLPAPSHNESGLGDGYAAENPYPKLYPQPPWPGQPFRLALTTRHAEATYLFQASTNLADWQTISTNTAAGFLVEFHDPDAGKFPMRFYRALLVTE